MQKIISLLIGLFIVGCSNDDDFGSNCRKAIKGDGINITKEIDIEPIHGVAKSGSFNVIFRHGNEQKIVARGDSNILDYLNLTISEGIWELKLMEDYCYQEYNLTIDIQLPSLEKIVSSGSGNIEIVELISKTNMFALEKSGSGNIMVQEPSFVDNANFICSGSGNVSSFNLLAKQVQIVSSGSSNIEISASEQLTVQNSGSGNIYYKGNPTTDIQSSGSGRVIDAN